MKKLNVLFLAVVLSGGVLTNAAVAENHTIRHEQAKLNNHLRVFRQGVQNRVSHVRRYTCKHIVGGTMTKRNNRLDCK